MEKKQNVPALRFQGFSGEWERKTLEEMGSSFSYGLNAAATTYDGQHKYLRITDIDDEFRKFSGKELTSPNVDVSTASDYKLQENDIVFARTGASVGKTYLYDTSDGDVYYAGFLIRVKIDSKYDANFVFQKTLSSDYSHFVVVTSQRSGQPGINAKEYAAWEMLVPELGEQKNIGGFFTDFDKNIFVCRKKIQKLQQFRQAMLAKLFPREGAAEPELRFRGFADKWEQCAAKKIFESKDDRNHPDLPVLTATQEYGMVRRDHINYNVGHDKRNEVGYKRVLPGQFVIHLRSFQGGFAHSPLEGITSPAYTVMAFRAGEKHDEYFWKYVFLSESFIKRLSTVTYGIRDGRSISFEDFGELQLRFPSKEEQVKIGTVLKKIDSFISLQQKKLERMQRLKGALLEKMFV